MPRSKTHAFKCPFCGHVGDPWFDRTICVDRCSENDEDDRMHYRCVACGKCVCNESMVLDEEDTDVEA